MFHHGNGNDYLMKVWCRSPSDNSLTPVLNYYGIKTRVKFTRNSLKQSNISYNHGKNSKYLHCL